MAEIANTVKDLIADDLAFYRSQHQTKGCKITHMIGVPLLVISLLTLPFDRKLSSKLQAIGWFFQLLGHLGFEHNTPVVMEMQSPSMLMAAVFFVGERWKRFLTGKTI